MAVTGNAKEVVGITEFGLSKVVGVSVLLIGTGTIAGIIKASALQYDVISLLETLSMPAFVLAPLAGILMAGATASTTAGATIAAQTFAPTLMAQGVPALSAGAMIHAGATGVDSLPHGSFFHATGGSVNLTIAERMKLIPFEACVGLTATLVSVVLFLLVGSVVVQPRLSPGFQTVDKVRLPRRVPPKGLCRRLAAPAFAGVCMFAGQLRRQSFSFDLCRICPVFFLDRQQNKKRACGQWRKSGDWSHAVFMLRRTINGTAKCISRTDACRYADAVVRVALHHLSVGGYAL